MIQFNLLPDVKLAYIRALRTKRLVAVISTLAAVGSLAIMLTLLSTVDIVQKHLISDNNNQINTYISNIQSTPSLNNILTVQNQITALPKLYDGQPVSSRVFDYIADVTPAAATISSFQISFSGPTAASTDSISISGAADTVTTVNKFVDTLEFSTYGTSAAPASTKTPFTNVVLSSFGYSTATGADYTITANFNPIIFERTSTGGLTVPNLITTRSELDQPQILFKPQPIAPKTTTTTNS